MCNAVSPLFGLGSTARQTADLGILQKQREKALEGGVYIYNL